MTYIKDLQYKANQLFKEYLIELNTRNSKPLITRGDLEIYNECLSCNLSLSRLQNSLKGNNIPPMIDPHYWINVTKYSPTLVLYASLKAIGPHKIFQALLDNIERSEELFLGSLGDILDAIIKITNKYKMNLEFGGNYYNKLNIIVKAFFENNTLGDNEINVLKNYFDNNVPIDKYYRPWESDVKYRLAMAMYLEIKNIDGM